MRIKLTLLLLAISAIAGAQSIHINDGGTLREITEVWINDGGTLREISEGWINDGGTLRQFYGSETVTVSGESVAHSVSNGSTATAGVRINSDGTIDKLVGAAYSQIDASTDWVIPNGYSGTYHVKFSAAGDTPTGTLDTWLAVTGSPEVYLSHSTNDAEESTLLTVAVSGDGGSTTLDSGLYTLSATVGTPP